MDLDRINNFKNLHEIAEILESCKNNDYNNQSFNSIFEHIINSEIYENPDWGESKNTTENLINKIKTFYNNTNSESAIKEIKKQLFINQIKNELSNKIDNKPETTLKIQKKILQSMKLKKELAQILKKLQPKGFLNVGRLIYQMKILNIGQI